MNMAFLMYLNLYIKLFYVDTETRNPKKLSLKQMSKEIDSMLSDLYKASETFPFSVYSFKDMETFRINSLSIENVVAFDKNIPNDELHEFLLKNRHQYLVELSAVLNSDKMQTIMNLNGFYYDRDKMVFGVGKNKPDNKPTLSVVPSDTKH